MADANGLSVQPDEADCMAAAMMAELGVEPFETADVAPDDIVPERDSSPGALLGDGTVTERPGRRDPRQVGGLR